MSSFKGLRKILANATGMVIIILSILALCSDFSMFIFPKISFKKSPEFIQDTADILDNNSKEWLETQIKSRAKETSVAIVLDCQKKEFEISKNYVNTVISREIENVYNSQKYLVITYFEDVRRAKISTNIDQNGISSYRIEDIENAEDLLKEVSYLTLRLNDKMKPVKMDIVKEKRNILIVCIVCIIVSFLLGLNILTINIGTKRKRREDKAVKDKVIKEEE